MNTTETKGSLFETMTADGIAGWWLSIVHHTNTSYLGLRAPITSHPPLELGREAIHFGPRVLMDKRVSRRHATVTVEGGQPTISDLESRNGTFVNGDRINSTPLTAGDVIGVGSILFILHQAPAFFDDPNNLRLIGKSWALSRVLSDVQKVAPFETSVLILGETGTGKELVAHEVHRLCGRDGPFMSVNCGGMTDNLLQSELFGHTRGAFSGADRDRTGLLESASGGTVFLDEIGDATPTLQVSLLRFLQEGEIRKIGSNRTITVNTRVIAATNQDLKPMVESGEFREDLYARLASWIITVPPLRERREDITLLARHFMAASGAADKPLHHRLARRLLAYDWPRNVRELKAVVERAAIDAAGHDTLRLTPALERLLEIEETRKTRPAPGKTGVRAAVEKPDSATLRELLVSHRANIRAVANSLGTSRNTLYRWMKEAHINLDEIRVSLRSKSPSD